MDVIINKSNLISKIISNDDNTVILKKKDNLPWSEKYRPDKISNIIYHEKITNAIINYMENNKLPHLLFYGPPGTGKCLAYDTPVIMYNGEIKKVQDIKLNDLLMGDDNKPRKILNTVVGADVMYKIIQENGDDYIVNSDHIISLKLVRTFITILKNNQYILYWFENHVLKKKIFENSDDAIIKYNNFKLELEKNNNINKIGDICDISIKDYIDKENHWKNSYNGYKTNQINCWKTKKVLLDPYLIGYWIADSNKFTHMYNITDEFKNGLIEYNLLNDKYIPNDYKINDIETRLKLLAGFLDNISNITKDNYFEFTYDSNKIIEDITFIARSLGFMVHITKLKVQIYGYELKLIPTKNQIKNIEYKDFLNYKIKIEKLDIDKYYGFEIDGNKRFLLGDFTVTHNTSTIIAIAKHYYKDDFDNMILVLNASEERGIETVRNRIKQFVITKGTPTNKDIPPFKLIILDEIDAMTEDAQAILRKVIEKYVTNVRFCFICNYLKKINPAIQSRCIIFRFNPIPYKNMSDFIIKICEYENIQITFNGLNLIIKKSNGDMRKLLNILQSIYMYLNTNNKNKLLSNKIIFDSDKNDNEDNDIIINELIVSKILSCPTHKHINNILLFIQKYNFKKSYYYINKLLIDFGISLIELVNYIYEYCLDYIINNNTSIIKYPLKKVVNIIKNICLINENLTYCNNDNIQLVSFLSIFYLE
jgi:replication factor C subunit 3/5